MKITGIRINDLDEDRVVSVELPDILEEISNGDQYYWSIFFSIQSSEKTSEKTIE